MFIVIQYDFNNMEDDLGFAKCSNILGYKKSYNEAYQYICELDSNYYKGWDGMTYPHYDIKEIKEIQNESIQ
jgi:hypothetical protein